MEIPLELTKWLISTGVVTEEEIIDKNEGNATLNEEATELFEIGLKVPTLIYRLHELKVILYLIYLLDKNYFYANA